MQDEQNDISNNQSRQPVRNKITFKICKRFSSSYTRKLAAIAHKASKMAIQETIEHNLPILYLNEKNEVVFDRSHIK